MERLVFRVRLAIFRFNLSPNMPKLAFSTLGCPHWSLDTIIRTASALGFRGIEVRGLQDDLDVTSRPEFTTEAGRYRRQLQDDGLQIVCFSSSVMLSRPAAEAMDGSLDEVRRYAELCGAFDAPFIRVFGGSLGSIPRAEALGSAVARLQEMAEIVKHTQVRILVETHDDWMRADDMKALLTATASHAVAAPAIGMLWDVNHPFMFLGEPPATTWEASKAWIHHTHWKDSKRDPGARHGFVPCLMGHGDVPHREIHAVLHGGKYEGYYSLEWEKRWHPEIAGPEVAFPQFAEYMKQFV
jgi:sugar phosphate isomerase/epimerase